MPKKPKPPGEKLILIAHGYRKGSPPPESCPPKHPGKRGQKGEGMLWPERKQNCNLNLTPTALGVLEELATKGEMSRSEIIEQWLRSFLPDSTLESK